MNIVLYGRPQALYVYLFLNALFAALESNGLSYRINRDFARLITEKTGRAFGESQLYDDSVKVDPRQDIMVSYGGDGTFSGLCTAAGSSTCSGCGDQLRPARFSGQRNQTGNGPGLCRPEVGKLRDDCRTMIRIEGEFLQNPRFRMPSTKCRSSATVRI